MSKFHCGSDDCGRAPYEEGDCRCRCGRCVEGAAEEGQTSMVNVSDTRKLLELELREKSLIEALTGEPLWPSARESLERDLVEVRLRLFALRRQLDGVAMRDEFAIRLAAALLSQQKPHTCPRCANYGAGRPGQELARAAYTLADEMLRYRESGEEEGKADTNEDAAEQSHTPFPTCAKCGCQAVLRHPVGWHRVIFDRDQKDGTTYYLCPVCDRPSGEDIR